MVKVEFIVDTRFEGSRKRKGENAFVKDNIAARWAAKNIAKVVSEEYSTAVDADNEETETKTDAVADYESLTTKELYKLCIERNIEVEQKQKKEYYVNALSAE